MKSATILFYDGSFHGFLCCVFEYYEQKLEVRGIYIEATSQENIFAKSKIVITDSTKAERVVVGLKNSISKEVLKELYFAFLSEIEGIELKLLHYIQLIFKKEMFNAKDFGNPLILNINQTAKKVSREKHRMEAFVRFQLTKDDIFFASIEPDFNVLPIILKHFESRFTDQKWIIYDLKRNFGLFYNLQETSYINLDFNSNDHLKSQNTSIYKASEVDFQKLWQEYFKSINIKSRKNKKLHLQHVPKRYWKYLTEKSTWPN